MMERDMMSSRFLYQLVPSEPLTRGTGCSSSPSARTESSAESPTRIKDMTPEQMVEMFMEHHNRYLPTPVASDYKGKTSAECMNKNGWDRSNNLKNFPTVLEMHGASADGTLFLLNPRFAAEMMGFPTDWCDI